MECYSKACLASEGDSSNCVKIVPVDKQLPHQTTPNAFPSMYFKSRSKTYQKSIRISQDDFSNDKIQPNMLLLIFVHASSTRSRWTENETHKLDFYFCLFLVSCPLISFRFAFHSFIWLLCGIARVGKAACRRSA